MYLQYLLVTSLLVLFSVPTSAYNTLIDVLSNDARFSTLIRHLQHARLVPELNRLESGTLFAPDNDAFAQFDGDMTREKLLYHLLPNGLTTNNFSHGQLVESKYVRPGMLGPLDPGQRIKITTDNDDIYINEAAIIQKDVYVNRLTYIQTINQVLVPPSTLDEIFRKDDLFYGLLEKSGVASVLKEERPFTIFKPHQDVLDCFNAIEKEYMVGPFGIDDLTFFVQYMVMEDAMYTADISQKNASYDTLSGESLFVQADSDHGSIKVNGVTLSQADILAANGVIHQLAHAFIPPSLTFDQRKYLYGLKATKFVALLDKYGLGHFLNATTQKYTFLVPGNDAIDIPHDQQHKDWLSYHVLTGNLTPDYLDDGALLATEFISQQLGNVPQRIPVHIHAGSDTSTRWIRFGQSHVVGDPVSVNGHVIYQITESLSLPGDIISSIAIDLDVSAFVASLYVSEIAMDVIDARGISLFVPSNDAFESLGLIARYLMHPLGKATLQEVLRYHVIEGLLYQDDMRQYLHEMPTLAGNKIHIGPGADDDLQIIVTQPSHIAHEPATVLSSSDLLVSNGVVHKVDKVLLPEHISIYGRDLLVGAQANTMLKVLDAVGLLDALNQTDYVILAPSDRAFDKLNIEELFNDPYSLERLAKLHVLPAPWQDLWQKKHHFHHDEHATFLSDDDTLIFHQDGNGEWSIRVKGQPEAEPAKIKATGRMWDAHGMKGGVVLIDTVLIPIRRGFFGLPWFWSNVVVGVSSIVTAAILGAGGFFGYKLYRRIRLGYQRIE
ncbi:fas1 domain-containing protein [Lichtheimia corymbifera JMRC:FSU:9682]|uniref:Fas1 domain-containing protein n=1 Tax=Lichtheimia corymbifera JMRC:FSU:9682 TaxID=1263082 RepID=A0A068RXW9_9FUNG|nr:fas1 domain-containing protein [Lichtheimia corymbifera JMRC:FSU:9682]